MTLADNHGSRRRVLVFGTGNLAQLVHALASDMDGFEIAAFTVEASHIDAGEFCALPVVPFETCEREYSPEEYSVLVATGPRRINRDRARFVAETIDKGYELAQFLHPTAWISPDVQLGANCIVLPHVTIEPSCSIGSNCIFWSSSLVAHHTEVADDCFFAPRAVVAGCCSIGHGSFLGVNCTIRDHVRIAPETIVGAGVVIKKNTQRGAVYSQENDVPHRLDSSQIEL